MNRTRPAEGKSQRRRTLFMGGVYVSRSARLEEPALEVSLKAQVAWIEFGWSEVMNLDTTEDLLLAQAVSALGYERVESGLEV